ncbi:helix-turn-helix domain-containing protein [Oerskovia sp. NPDC060338]|uniref:helix-turn-helix domain-containing protein n=1 Tax=Oerskovia sp. NPDC060338 TaxID=3347100 RepID=UPI00364E511E
MTTSTRIDEGLAEAVKAAMKGAGQSQRKVAAQTGIPLVTLHRRLSSPDSTFKVTEVVAIADLLNVSVVGLFQEAERRASDGHTAPAA